MCTIRLILWNIDRLVADKQDGWREIRVISCNVQGVGAMWLHLDHRFLLMGGDRNVRHPVGCLDYRPYVGWETRPHWFIALLQVVCLPMNMVACLLARVPSFPVAQLGSCLGTCICTTE